MSDAFSDKNLPNGVYMVNTPLGRVRSDAIFKGVGQQNEGSALRADQMLSWRPREGSAQWSSWGNIYNYGGGTDEAFALDTGQKFSTAAPAAPVRAPSSGGGGGGRPAPAQPSSPFKHPSEPVTPGERAEISKPASGLEDTIKTVKTVLKRKLAAGLEKRRRTYLSSGK